MGEVRPDEGTIDIPALERIASPTWGPGSPNDDSPGLSMAAHGNNIRPERRTIRWISVQFIWRSPDERRVVTVNSVPISRFEVWFPADPWQRILWGFGWGWGWLRARGRNQGGGGGRRCFRGRAQIRGSAPDNHFIAR